MKPLEEFSSHLVVKVKRVQFGFTARSKKNFGGPTVKFGTEEQKIIYGGALSVGSKMKMKQFCCKTRGIAHVNSFLNKTFTFEMCASNFLLIEKIYSCTWLVLIITLHTR
jgi:hypothetical protein